MTTDELDRALRLRISRSTICGAPGLPRKGQIRDELLEARVLIADLAELTDFWGSERAKPLLQDVERFQVPRSDET